MCVTWRRRTDEPARTRPRRRQESPSWLVFEDDAPWLVFGAGFELSDIPRNHQLGSTFTPRTNDIVNDKQLEQRYKAAARAAFRREAMACRKGWGRIDLAASASRAGTAWPASWSPPGGPHDFLTCSHSAGRRYGSQRELH